MANFTKSFTTTGRKMGKSLSMQAAAAARAAQGRMIADGLQTRMMWETFDICPNEWESDLDAPPAWEYR